MSTSTVNEELLPGVMVTGKVCAIEKGASIAYDVITKFSFPALVIVTLCVGEELIGISPKSTADVVKSYLGPKRVTLPLVEFTLTDSPFWSERTMSDINKL